MEVKYMNLIRDMTHKKYETVKINGTMKDLLDYECNQYGESFKHIIYDNDKLKESIQIILNGRLLSHDFCLYSKIKNEDHVCISCNSHCH